MYNQTENELILAGNAVWLDLLVHMDIKGNIVDDESKGFRRPVTIKFTCTSNVFVMDETGSNTHGKAGSQKGDEKYAVPRGKVPSEEVGVTNSHFTLTPFNN